MLNINALLVILQEKCTENWKEIIDQDLIQLSLTEQN